MPLTSNNAQHSDSQCSGRVRQEQHDREQQDPFRPCPQAIKRLLLVLLRPPCLVCRPPLRQALERHVRLCHVVVGVVAWAQVVWRPVGGADHTTSSTDAAPFIRRSWRRCWGARVGKGGVWVMELVSIGRFSVVVHLILRLLILVLRSCWVSWCSQVVVAVVLEDRFPLVGILFRDEGTVQDFDVGWARASWCQAMRMSWRWVVWLG